MHALEGLGIGVLIGLLARPVLDSYLLWRYYLEQTRKHSERIQDEINWEAFDEQEWGVWP